MTGTDDRVVIEREGVGGHRRTSDDGAMGNARE
jgi:hypothetical protein